MENLVTEYRFLSEKPVTFRVEIDPETLTSVDELPELLPEWTKLEFNQCPHCPLSSETQSHCPLATRLSRVIQQLDELQSFDEIELEVETAERRFRQQTTAQRAIGSLMGLVIGSCGCPHTAFFKTMARYHLPLATEEETMTRATSMYLLAQYFLYKSGQVADFDFQELKKIYKNIQDINIAICDRLRAACKEDASINAITILDFYAKCMPFAIEDSLEEIRYVFNPYLTEYSENIL